MNELLTIGTFTEFKEFLESYFGDSLTSVEFYNPNSPLISSEVRITFTSNYEDEVCDKICELNLLGKDYPHNQFEFEVFDNNIISVSGWKIDLFDIEEHLELELENRYEDSALIKVKDWNISVWVAISRDKDGFAEWEFNQLVYSRWETRDLIKWELTKNFDFIEYVGYIIDANY